MVDHEVNLQKEESKINTSDKIVSAESDKSQLKWKHMKKTLTNTEILAQALLFLVNII